MKIVYETETSDKQRALKRDFIYNMMYSSKKVFQAFINIYYMYKLFDKHYVLGPLAHFLRST